MEKRMMELKERCVAVLPDCGLELEDGRVVRLANLPKMGVCTKAIVRNALKAVAAGSEVVFASHEPLMPNQREVSGTVISLTADLNELAGFLGGLGKYFD